MRGQLHLPTTNRRLGVMVNRPATNRASALPGRALVMTGMPTKAALQKQPPRAVTVAVALLWRARMRSAA